ncbi:ATP-binding protein [Desulfonema magnum]|uniref:Histidine kinase and STAS domains-containing protein n=1 Tax=Desulfonema magnum TaxID=45655 RepID=A0A975BRX3_9BACT|nr:ATP-binding protein [Desulfonema magnum]QTA90488.1 Histidine kinase and STAS domains-containing protein [Desulfonema magnum]
MFEMSENDNTICLNFSSEMHLVDRVIQTCRDYLKRFDVSDFSHFRQAFRELLLNAVEHGNLKIADRVVMCSIEHLDKWQFRITVEDEGDGFDYKSLDMKLPSDPHQIRKRGYALINTFTDRLEFNNKGNRVIAYISIPEMTTLSICEENGWQVITPSGDLTASIADRFRAVLVRLLDQGYGQYCFDFTHVEDIDSVALSVMIVFSKMLAQKNPDKKLKIVNAGKGLTELFHMTRMDRIYIVISKAISPVSHY